MRRFLIPFCVLAPFYLSSTDYTWNGGYYGDWDNPGNWNPNTSYPNTSSDVANFNLQSYSYYSIGIPTDIVVGTLNINGNINDIGFNNNNSSISIYNSFSVENQTNCSFFCPVILAEDVQININGGNTTLHQASGDGGIILNAINYGLLVCNGPVSYTGDTHIVQGTFQGGFPDVFPPYSAFILDNNSTAVVNAGGSNQTIASLTGGSLTSLTLQGSILTLGDDTSTTFAGTISDSGRGGGEIVKQGIGTFVISGNNTYSGNTTLKEGQLTLANDSAISSGTLTVYDGTTIGLTDLVNIANTIAVNDSALATLFVDTDNTSTLSGNLSTSTASLTKSGNGTLIITGTNNCSGGMNINAGILSVSSEPNLGTSDAPLILSGGILSVTGDITTEKNISVTDNSAITTAGGKTTSLTGVLTGANAATLSLSGSGITSLSAIEVNGNDSFTIGGVIGGSGGLAKTGTGTLNFTGNSTYTGLTTISEGTFAINGIVAGSVLSSSGTTVKGTGSVQGELSIGDGSVLSPGNSIGTLTVSSLVLDQNSTTNIEIDPSASSAIKVNGNATLAGALHIIQDEGNYASRGTYEILSAENIIGAFNSLTGGLPGFRFTLSTNSDSLYLNYFYKIDTDGLKGNNLKFANYLNKSAPISEEYQALTLLSGGTLNDALSSASPARNAFGPFVTQQTMFSISHVLNSYLAHKRFLSYRYITTNQQISHNFQNLIADNSDFIQYTPKHKSQFEVWISGFADFAHQGGESQNPSFNFTSQGVLLGFDYTHLHNDLIGGAVGYAHSHIHDDDHMGKANIPYYFASLYGNFEWGQLYLEPAFWAVYHQIHNQRRISYPDLSTKANSDINGWQIDPHLELGYDIDMSWSRVEPFIGFDWVVNWEGSFKEYGASNLNMRQKSHTSSMLQSEIGLRFYQSIAKAIAHFGFKEGISYINRCSFGTGKVSTAIIGSSNFVTLQSFSKAQNLGAIEIDFFAEVGKKNDICISLGYEGEFGSSYVFNEILVKFAKKF